MNQKLTTNNIEPLEQKAISEEDTSLLEQVMRFLGAGTEYFRKKYGENSPAYELSQVIITDCLIESREAEQILIDHPEETEPRYVKGRDYYIPRTRREVENWLLGYHRQRGIQLPKGFRKRSKAAQYAMYFGIRDREG